jgi:hypothetical protein
VNRRQRWSQEYANFKWTDGMNDVLLRYADTAKEIFKLCDELRETRMQRDRQRALKR